MRKFASSGDKVQIRPHSTSMGTVWRRSTPHQWALCGEGPHLQGPRSPLIRLPILVCQHLSTAQKITGCSLPTMENHCPLLLPRQGQLHHERLISPRPPPVYSPTLGQTVQVLQIQDHASKGQLFPDGHQNIRHRHAPNVEFHCAILIH